jgi:5-methylcytosine-specific restriction protein A
MRARLHAAAIFATSRLAQLFLAQRRGMPHIDINAGELHRRLGGYPGRSHQMPSCCQAMYAEKKIDDMIISQPPEGKGATLTIRYKLPRGVSNA